MIEYTSFNEEYLEEAGKLAYENYLEECEHVPALPGEVEIPDLSYYAKNGFGVCAIEEGKLLGFIGVYEPWEGAFDTFDSLGTFSPCHAHGAVKDNRARIYQDMYEYAAAKWVNKGIIGLGIALYAHDEEAKRGLFEHGFGMRCKDAITLLCDIALPSDKLLEFAELRVEDFPLVRDMRAALDNHLKESPCFMQSTEEEFESWLSKVEKGDRRTFIARKNGLIAAYLDVTGTGETFITDHPKMVNIHGAYCRPEFRGQKVIDQLLGYMAKTLADEGNIYLGVDFESYNPAANRFWTKHFSEYTNSVVRKIETWSIGK